MKKILFLLACTLLVGCCAPDGIPDPIIIGEGASRRIVRPYHIEYNGHKYIYFSGSNGFSMIHDPDCSCCKEESTLW